ncbi:MAG: L-threonylcarbamoyladenylate synthase [Flavobacteriaceae bacterium]
MADIYQAGSEGAVAGAARALAAGGLAVLPTETVYGLAADATNPDAVAAIYAAKGRPSFNPLIAHVDSMAMARGCGSFSEDANRLAAAFWPGPLTLVVPRAPGSPVAELATAGLDSIAIRMPAHETMRRIIGALGRPLVAPSANASGRITATRLEDALADLEPHIAVGIDDGPCRLGIESTIVACLGGAPVLLRPGAVPREEIERVAGRLASPATSAGPQAPGMLASHYAPGAPVRLNARGVRPGEALMDFAGGNAGARGEAAAYADLSPSGDDREAAARLFETMRLLDAGKPVAIAVSPIPDAGLGLAINDRLRRAAAPRDPAGMTETEPASKPTDETS